MALFFLEFPHDLDGLLDSLGVGLPLNLITLYGPHRYITGFAGLCCFWCFYILAFWDVFGCDVGHLKTLALIPIDVYVGGKRSKSNSNWGLF